MDDYSAETLSLTALALVTALMDELNTTHPGIARRALDRAIVHQTEGRAHPEVLTLLARYRSAV